MPSIRSLASTSARSSDFPRHFPTSGFKILPTSEKIDEESLERYSSREYFPVHLGQVFNSRYQVMSKLRFGPVSTTWLGRDLWNEEYVTLEICRQNCSGVARAQLAYKRFNALEPEGMDGGGLLDEFTIKGDVDGDNHHCFVTPPLTLSIQDFRRLAAKESWNPLEFRCVVYSIVRAVNFIHSELKLVHCDLAMDRFLILGFGDAHLEFIEESEFQSPSARKVDEDRVIHTTPFIVWPLQPSLEIVPTGFWSSLPGDAEDILIGNQDPQFRSCRSPEMVLNAPFSYPTDIYSLGCMLWHLAEGKPLFFPHEATETEAERYSLAEHLMQMVDCMGPPSAKVIDRSPAAGSLCKVPKTFPATPRIEERVTAFKGKNKVEFLRLIRRCLEWDPDERITAAELCEYPWLVNADKESELPSDSGSGVSS